MTTIGRRPGVMRKLMAPVSPRDLATLSNCVLYQVILLPWTGMGVGDVTLKGWPCLRRKEELANQMLLLII